MAKQLNVDMRFTADTSKAKQSITELQQAIQKLGYGTVSKGVIDPAQFEQASSAARELAYHLNNAYNAKTGNLDLSKLNASLKQAGTTLPQLTANFKNAGEAGQQAFVSLAKAIANADQPTISVNTHLSTMFTTLKNVARFQISSSIMHGLIGGIQTAYGYAQDLNKSLNNIRIVTGQSTDQMARFAQEANSAARSLSATTLDYTNASLIYYQQGLDDEAVKARADVTVKLANISRQSAEEVSNQMTAIWNNFEDGSHSLEYYADVITALGAATASSSAEIAGGLEKFASVAETVGLSYEYATTALATIVATTRQSEDTVGTGLRTIFSRLQGLSLGETLEDGTTLTKYSKALATIGVDIKDQTGNLKDMNQILDEIGQKWQTLTKDQQVALAQTVGGVRQYTNLVALFDNWNKFQENLGVATGAEGTLQKQANIYAESWEAARDRVKTATEDIYTALIDEDFFIGIDNVVEHILVGIKAFIDGFGGLKSLLVSGLSFVLSMTANKIGPAVQKVIQDIQIMTGGASKVYQKMQGEFNQAVESELATKTYTPEGEAELRSYSDLLSAKTKLAAINNKLSASEKMRADLAIAGFQHQAEEIKKLTQDYVSAEEKKEQAIEKRDNLEKQVEEEEKERARALLEQNQKIQEKQQAAEDYKQREITYETDNIRSSALYEKALAMRSSQDESNALYNPDADAARLDALVQQAESVSQSIREKFINALTIDPTNSLQLIDAIGIEFTEKLTNLVPEDEDILKLEKSKGDLQILMDGLGDLTQYAPEVQAAFESALEAENVTQYKAAIENLNDKLQNCTITGNNFVKVLKAQGIDASVIRKYEAALKDVAAAQEKLENLEKQGLKSTDAYKKAVEEAEEATKKAAEAKEEAARAQANLNNQVKNFQPEHFATGSEAFTSIIASLGKVSMAVNAVKSLIDTWNNTELTFGEKLTASFMSLSMLMPAIIGIFTTFGTVMSFIEGKTISNSVATLANVAALSAEATAAEKANAANAKKLAIQKLLSTGMKQEVIAAIELALADKTLATSTNEAAIATALKNQEIDEEIAKTAAAIVAKNASAAAEQVESKSIWATVKALIAKSKALKLLSGPIGWAIAAIMILVGAFTILSRHQKEKREADLKEAEAAAEAAKKANEEADANRKLLQTYNETKKAYDDGAASKEELRKAAEDVTAAYKIENAELLIAAGAYEEIAKQAREAAKAEAEEANLAAKRALGSATVAFSDIAGKNGKGYWAGHDGLYGEYNIGLGNGTFTSQIEKGQDEYYMNEAVKNITAAGKINAELLSIVTESGDLLFKADKSAAGYLETYEAMLAITDEAAKLAASDESFKIIDSETYVAAMHYIEQMREAYERLKNAQDLLVNTDLDALFADMNTAEITTLEQYTAAIQQMKDTLLNDNNLKGTLTSDEIDEIANNYAKALWPELTERKEALEYITTPDQEEFTSWLDSLSDAERKIVYSIVLSLNGQEVTLSQVQKLLGENKEQVESSERQLQIADLEERIDHVKTKKGSKGYISQEDWASFYQENEDNFDWKTQGITSLADFLLISPDKKAEILTAFKSTLEEEEDLYNTHLLQQQKMESEAAVNTAQENVDAVEQKFNEIDEKAKKAYEALAHAKREKANLLLQLAPDQEYQNGKIAAAKLELEQLESKTSAYGAYEIDRGKLQEKVDEISGYISDLDDQINEATKEVTLAEGNLTATKVQRDASLTFKNYYTEQTAARKQEYDKALEEYNDKFDEYYEQQRKKADFDLWLNNDFLAEWNQKLHKSILTANDNETYNNIDYSIVEDYMNLDAAGKEKYVNKHSKKLKGIFGEEKTTFQLMDELDLAVEEYNQAKDKFIKDKRDKILGGEEEEITEEEIEKLKTRVEETKSAWEDAEKKQKEAEETYRQNDIAVRNAEQELLNKQNALTDLTIQKTSLETSLEEAQKELDTLENPVTEEDQARKEVLEKQIADAQAELDAYEKQIEAATNQVTEAQRVADEANTEKNEAELELAAAQQALVEAQTKLQAIELGLIEDIDSQDTLDWVNKINTSFEKLDLKYDDIKDYAEYLRDAAKEGDGVAKSLAGQIENSVELAAKLTLLQKAVDNLHSNLSKYDDVLKGTNKGTKAYKDQLLELQDIMSDFTSSADTKVDGTIFDGKFFEENSEIIEKAAEGDKEAIWELQKAAAEQIILNIDKQSSIEEFQTAIEGLESLIPEDLEIGTSIGEIDGADQFINSLNELLAAGEITADEVNAVLSSIGFDPSVEYKTISLTADQVSQIRAGQSLNIEGKTVTADTVAWSSSGETGTVSIPVINSSATTSSGRGGGIKAPGGSKGGGGGGGGKQSTKEKKNPTDEKDRYHTITEKIADAKNAYEELSKAEDRAFGKDKLKAMSGQTNNLKQQVDLQKRYIQEIRDYLKGDQAEVAALGAKFDANGVISNYDALIESLVEEYNKGVDKFNAGGIDEEKFKEQYEEPFNKAKESIDQYVETINLLQSEELNLIDLQNQLADSLRERIEAKIKIDIDLSEDDLKLLEYYLDKLEDNAYDAAESIGLIGKQVEEWLGQSESYQNSINDLLKIHLTDEEIQKFNEGLLTTEDLLNKGFTEQDVEDLRSWNESLLDINKSLDEAAKTVGEKFMTSLSSLNDEIEESQERFDQLTSIVEHYENIIDIVGKDNLDIADSTLALLRGTVVDAAIAEVNTAKHQFDSFKAIRQEIIDRLSSGELDEAGRTYWEEQQKKVEQELYQAQEDYMSSFEDAIQGIFDSYSNTLTDAINTFLVNSGLGDSLGGLKDYLKEADEQNVSSTTKVYELTKLTRDIQKSMDESPSIKGKTKLLELQNKISDAMKDGKEYSQAQLDILRKEYELMEAQLALEDMAQAKSTVRMSRDNEGNWSYVYVADEEKIANAEQELDDKLYEYNQLVEEQYQELLTIAEDMTTAWAEEYQAIMEDTTITDEERMARLALLNETYQETLDDLNEKQAWMVEQADVLNQEEYQSRAKAIDIIAQGDEHLQNVFENTAWAQAANLESMEETLAAFTENSQLLLATGAQAYEDYQDANERAFQAAGYNIEQFTENGVQNSNYFATAILNDADAIKNAISTTETETNNLAENMKTMMEEVANFINEWKKNYTNAINEICKFNEKLVTSCNELIKQLNATQQAQIDAGGGADVGGTEGGGSTRGQLLSSSSGDSNGSSGGGGTGGGNPSGGGTITYGDWEDWTPNGPTGHKRARAKFQNGTLIGVERQTAPHDHNKRIPTGNTVTIYCSVCGYSFGSTSAFRSGGYTGNWPVTAYTGMYTGEWDGPNIDSNGRLAVLHQKELVLNASDTENMLSAIKLIREINKTIDLQALISSQGLGLLSPGYINSNNGVLDQNVHIDASFPNVTNHIEIEEAFHNLVGKASQFAQRNKT